MSRLLRRIIFYAVFLLEIVFYAALVSAYMGFIFFFLDGWLKHIFDTNIILYAFLALALIVTQGFLLEKLTGALLRVIRHEDW